MGTTGDIFFAGLSSGIQWDRLIDELVSIERRNVDRLIDSRSKLVFERSVSLEVSSRLASLDIALSTLRLESTFLAKTAVSSDASTLTATASTDAVAGSYLISISQLASPSAAASGLNGDIQASSAYLGAGNTANITALNVLGGFEPVRALPETKLNDLIQAGNLTAGDTIVVTGTDGNGAVVNETFTLNGDSTDTLERLAEFLIQAFNGTAQVSIGFSGEIVVRQVSGGLILSFDPSSDLTFNDNDFSGSTLSFGTGVSYTDGGGQGYGATDPLNVRGTGAHELSFTEGKAGFIISTGSLDLENTLENVGVTDFALTIDPDSSGAQTGEPVLGIVGKTTVGGLIDLVNYYVPDVSAYLDGGGNLVIQSNEGGRDIALTGSLGGVLDILFGGNLSLDTEAPDSVNSFGSTTDADDYTAVDRYFTEQGVTMVRKATLGDEGSAITDLVGGVGIDGGPDQEWVEGVAVIITSTTSELSSNPAIRGRVMGASGVSSSASTDVPRMDVTEPLANANFATAVTAGTFTINGTQFNVPSLTTTTVQDMMAIVNASEAGVVMEYDGASDRFIIKSADTGPQAITIGAGGDTSNFLDAALLSTDFGGSFLAGRDKGAVSTGVFLSTAGLDITPTTGTFTINGVSIYIDSSTDSLADVIKKINQSGAGVTASYSTATDKFSLVQKLDENTTASFIRVGGTTDTSTFLEAVRLTTTPTIETEIGTERKNALFSVDGVDYTRPTNNPEDIIGGVKLSLLGVTSGSVSLTIESDTEPIEDALVNFVVEWNTTMEFLNPNSLTLDERRQMEDLSNADLNNMSLTDIDEYNRNRQELRKRGFIVGDRTTQMVVDSLITRLMGLMEGGGRFNSLAAAGITTAGGGEAATVTENRGRLISNTTDADAIRSLIQANSILQDAIKNRPDDLFSLFSSALTSSAEVRGTKNLNAGILLSNALRFRIGDGRDEALVTIATGNHTMSQIGLAINQSLGAAGITGINASFGNGYELILLNELTNGLRAEITLQDLSEGTQGIFNTLGIESGVYLGSDPNITAGLSTRVRSYINSSTNVGGILFERTRSGGSFDRQIESLSDAIEQGELGLLLFEKRLRRKFVAMETALTELNAQSAWLEQNFLASLQQLPGT